MLSFLLAKASQVGVKKHGKKNILMNYLNKWIYILFFPKQTSYAKLISVSKASDFLK